MEARVGVEGHLVLAELEAGDAVFELPLEDVVVDGLRGRQLRAVDGGQLGQHRFRLRRLPLQVGQGHGRQPVVVLVPSHGGGEERILLEAGLPFAVEEVVELRDLVRRQGGEREKKEGQEDRKSLHGKPPEKVTRGV